ncbi:MAG: YmfQ family protein [Clostridiaceae bacterium]|nr:YmfQ family protein [Clostridiaceae bacterium]
MELNKMLPDFYNGNTTMQELQTIIGEKVNALASDLNEAIDQCFVNTASALLSRYEKLYGLQVDVSKSEEFRRERIRAKIRGIGTVTKKMVQDVARSFSNGEVEIVEDPVNYQFTVKFVGTKGIPPNMADLIITLEEIKPAHLTYTFEFIYRTHTELSEFTHSQLSSYTHSQLREGVMN